MSMHLLALAFCLLLQATNAKLLSQPLGISGSYLTTSIGIGTPPQYFDVAIDMTGDKLYVSDIATRDEAIDYQYDYIKALFVPEQSETDTESDTKCRLRYLPPDSYQVEQAWGTWRDDVITLGQYTAGNSVRICDLNQKRDQETTGADQLRWFMNLPIDGFLGLAPGEGNVLRKSSSGETLSQVTLYVNTNATDPDNAGTITFGGQDRQNCGAFRTFPSDDPDAMSFTVTKGAFSSKSVTQQTYSARFDFTTSKLMLPSKYYTMLSSYFGSSTSQFYCSSYANPPPLNITVYGTTYSIPIKPYIKPSSGSQCSLDIGYGQDSDEYQLILDRSFLNTTCVYFDYEQELIGLASAK